MDSMNGTGYPTLPQNECLVLDVYQFQPEHLTETVYANFVFTLFLNIIASPMSAFLSILVIYCVFTKRRLRKRNSNVFLALLSMTDLAVGAVGQPLYAASQVCRMTGGCNMCLIQTVPYVLNYALCFSSLFHLMLVAIDRLIAIKCTMRYQLIVTTPRIVLGTVSAWAVAIFSASLPFLGVKNSISSYIVIGFALSAVGIIVSCYIAIYIESRRHKAAIAAQIQQQERQNQARSVEFKALKTTSLVIAAAFVSYGVGGMIIIASKATFTKLGRNDVYWNLTTWGYTAILMNSLFNPMIYAFRNEEMRNAFKRVLCRNSVHPDVQQTDSQLVVLATSVAEARL